MKAHADAFSVYNMLRYSKSTMCKALPEKILHILIAGRLLKDAYVVVKVCHPMNFISSVLLSMNLIECIVKCFHDQDNGKLISMAAIKKFATIFMKSGNIDSINDVLKVIHGFGCKIDQVNNHRC